MPRSPKTKTMANTWNPIVCTSGREANTEVKNDLKWITSCFHHQHQHHQAASSAAARTEIYLRKTFVG